MLLILKIGGGAELLAETAQTNFARDVARFAEQNEIIIVNGGNSLLTKIQTERGIAPRMITSERGEKSRFTDAPTIELLKEVYGGVNRKLVELLRSSGVKAQGFFGSEQKLLLATQHGKQRIVEEGKIKIVAGDLTGKLESVNVEVLKNLLAQKIIPVLTPPAITSEDVEVNVDGDKIAAKVATTLRADKLIFFSNTPGLLRDVNDEASLVPEIKIAEADQYAEGRMKKKILSAARAVEAGVGEVMFADGRRENSISDALAGMGTRVLK